MKRAIGGYLLISLCTGFAHAQSEDKEKRTTVAPTQWVAYQAAYGMSVVADALSQQQAYNRGYTEHSPLYSGMDSDAGRTTARVVVAALTMWWLTKLHKKHPKAATRTIVGLTVLNFATAIMHDKRCQPDDLGNPTCPSTPVPPCPDNYSTCER